MTEAITDLIARLRPNIVVPQRQQALLAGPAVDIEVPRSLTVEDPGTGKTVITVKLDETSREAAGYSASDFIVKLRGNLVGEGINRNNAAWEKSDLAFGLPSVPNGPLNWLHEDRRIIGCLTDAQLTDEGSTVQADSVIWGWLYPNEAAAVEDQAVQGNLYYSMECISNEVQCVGPHGCGAMMPYVDSLTRTGAACEHVKDRASARRLVNPIFQGAAVIVPPKSPGWANAHLALMQETERTMPEAAEFTMGDAEVAAQIMSFIRG